MPEEDKLPLGKRPIDVLEKTGEIAGQVLASSPTLRAVGGVVNFVNTNLQSYAKQELDAGRGQLDPAVAIGSGLSLLGDASNVLRERATAFAEDRAIPAIEQATGQKVDPRAAGLYGEAVGAIPGEVAAAGLGKAVKVLKNVELPPPAMPKFQAVGASIRLDSMPAARANTEQLVNQPMQIASNLQRQSKWQAPVRELQKGDNTRQLAEFFRRGQGGKIKQKNLYVTADELAANKEGILDKMLERADKVDKAWDRYQARGSAKAQRNLYDIASKNIFEAGEMIYGKDAARDFLTKATNWASGDEWHHIFGNKEAGEFILMQAAQDPLVAVNIFAKMKALGLSSSGIADNIALMKKLKHTEWHDFMKAEGFEPKSAGKSEALLDFADLSQRVGKQIVEGDANVNDIFRMLDAYAGFNNYVRRELPKYGGTVVSDLPEGVGKALQIGGYKKAPKPSKTR